RLDTDVGHWPWHNIEAWAAGAKPAIRADWPEHVPDFEDVTKRPDFYVALDPFVPDPRNVQISLDTKEKINQFLNGLIDIGNSQIEELDREELASRPAVVETNSAAPDPWRASLIDEADCQRIASEMNRLHFKGDALRALTHFAFLVPAGKRFTSEDVGA